MPNLLIGELFNKVLLQALTKIDRTMFSSCTANGNGEVISSPGIDTGQPMLHKTDNTFKHILHHGLTIQEVFYRLFLPRKIPKLFIPMRVRQAAHIKDKVRIHRYTI